MWKKKLTDALPIRPGDTGILIVWDRTTGDFSAYFEGKSLTGEELTKILDATKKLIINQNQTEEEEGVLN